MSAFQWLESKPFERQILILALVLDPIGFGAGYLLGPSLGFEPILGGAFGLVAASLPLSAWVMRHASQQE